ncbi:MAG: hypothetical protein IK015_09700 [Treponema sp.]|nr:hypothetical protein [Treponema sp.]
MKKFFSVLLSIAFALCLFATLLLGVVRFNFSYSTITNIASQMLKPVSKAPVQQNKSGLFYPGEQVAVLANMSFEGTDFENFEFNFSAEDLKDLDLNAIVKDCLDQAGVSASPEFVADILASPEMSAFVDKYGEEVIDYLAGTKSELEVNPADVKKVLYKSIDLYEKHTGETVDRTGMDSAVENSIKKTLPQITASLDEVKAEGSQALDAVKAIAAWLELKMFIIFVAVCALLALVIFLINMNAFAMFKYISIPAIVDGALLLLIGALLAAVLPQIISEVAGPNIHKGVYEAILSYTTKIFCHMKIWGAAAAVCGVILCVLGFVLDKKTQKPNTAS